MGKGKLTRFNEMGTFKNVIQPHFNEVFNSDYYLKGNWRKEIFKNKNPLVLELGCGKGEYSTGLAEKFPEKNFLGIDIKGARMWKGAKYALINRINNVAFLRTRIELINSFFDENEVNEIWITFPDPQLKKRRNKKRLTSSRFLNLYRKFLIHDGIINLKTDSRELYEYTLNLAEYNNLKIIAGTHDLYNSDVADDILGIRTFYEQMFLKEGKPITYLKFTLNKNKDIKEPDEE